MRRPPRGSAGLAVATAALAISHLVWLLTGRGVQDYLDFLSAATGMLGVVAAVAILVGDVFEARLTALGLALGSVASQLLVGLLGAPGTAPEWRVSGLLRLGLGALVLALLARAARSRRARERVGDPYAL